jgi:hypothetical protein
MKETKERSFRCDACGRFLSEEHLARGLASRRLLTPDSDYSREEYETLCYGCQSPRPVEEEPR